MTSDQLAPKILPTPRDGPRGVGVHTTELPPGLGGIFALAPGGAQVDSGLAAAGTGRFPLLPEIPGPSQPRARGHSVAILRLTDLLQIPDPARRGRDVADPRGVAAEIGQAPAPLSHRRADGGAA